MNRRWTNREVTRLRELRAANSTNKEIAKELGRSPQSVRYAIAYYGVKRARKATRIVVVRMTEEMHEQATAARGPASLAKWIRQQITRGLRESGEMSEERKWPYETDTPANDDHCPDLVSSAIYGPHQSRVAAGRRYWKFLSKVGFDMFVHDDMAGMFARKRGKA